MVLRAGSVLLLLLLTACSAADDTGPPEEGQPREPRDVGLERISGGAPGQGVQRPGIVLAPSAAVMSEEIGAQVPDSGAGTYLAAYWGEKSTGGYSVNVGGVGAEGGRVTVELLLKGPPSDAIVTQVLTYPYVLAVVRDAGLREDFAFVDQDGRTLDWPVRRVGGWRLLGSRGGLRIIPVWRRARTFGVGSRTCGSGSATTTTVTT